MRIKGIERFAVLPSHPAYNSTVGILVDDPKKKILEKVKELLDSGYSVFLRTKELAKEKYITQE